MRRWCFINVIALHVIIIQLYSLHLIYLAHHLNFEYVNFILTIYLLPTNHNFTLIRKVNMNLLTIIVEIIKSLAIHLSYYFPKKWKRKI